MLYLCCAALVAACGIKKPLVAPKDIPAYESKQQEKIERKRQFDEQQRLKQSTTPSI